MTGYTILKSEQLPESLKNKPRWMICVIFTTGLLIMTLSAIAAGIFIGYTYCYVEHRTGFRAGNISRTQDLRIFNVPLGKTEETTNKNTINGALLSSQLVQRILKIAHTLWDKDQNDHVYLPGPLDEKILSKLEHEA